MGNCYVTLSDLRRYRAADSRRYITLGQLPSSREATVAEKAAATRLSHEIEGARSVRQAWEKRQDFINLTKPLKGWSDSCSSGFFSKCPQGDYDSLPVIAERIGAVIGDLTQEMRFDALSAGLDRIQRSLNQIQPGGKWDPTEAFGKEVLLLLGPAGQAAYLYQPKTSAEQVAQVQSTYAVWQQLLTIARDMGRLTPQEYSALRARADVVFPSMTKKVVDANRAGSSYNNPCASTCEQLTKFGVSAEACEKACKNGEVNWWELIPTWIKVAGGVTVVGAGLFYFGGFLKAAGNIAERATRSNED